MRMPVLSSCLRMPWALNRYTWPAASPTATRLRKVECCAGTGRSAVTCASVRTAASSWNLSDQRSRPCATKRCWKAGKGARAVASVHTSIRVEALLLQQSACTDIQTRAVSALQHC